MRVTRTRHPGITLTEVLVALFVMAIGMIALLVMFPLGAQQIAQAIKDERSAQAANNADNILRDHWRKHVIEYLKNGGSEANLVNPLSPDAIHYMMAMERPGTAPTNDVPNAVGAANNNQPAARGAAMPPLTDAAFVSLATEASRPSYPVFISPYYELSRNATGYIQSRRWVGGIRPNDAQGQTLANVAAGQTRVPRRTLNFPPQPQTGANGYSTQNSNWQFRMSTLMDDLDFDDDGNANVGGNITRTGRYNWDWVVQRPSQGNRLTMNLSVIVYDQRPYRMNRADDEVVYNVNGLAVGSLQVNLNYNAGATPPTFPPAIRAGQWIMDGTINNTLGIRNANFYRVTAVTDVPAAAPGVGQVRLDLQTPIRQPAGTAPATLTTYNAQFYILRGVAEVLERRPLTNDDAPVVP